MDDCELVALVIIRGGVSRDVRLFTVGRPVSLASVGSLLVASACDGRSMEEDELHGVATSAAMS